VKVVHVVAAGEIGGAERMLVDLARDQTDASIALFTPNDDLRKLFKDAGIPIDDRGKVREHPLAFLRPGDVGWLANQLTKRGAQAVHLHTFASQVLGTRAAQKVGIPVVRTEHSTRVYDDPSCRPFARWSLARADRVVFISEHVQRVANRRLPLVGRLSTAVIHNGIDVSRFSETPFMPSERLKLVAVGRLDPRKGLEMAIEAVGRVPSAELEIVGDGEERKRLEAIAGARVKFTGYAADVRAAIARSDALLTSAKEEGLGIALLEAMAMGRPVIGVPVGGIPEILINRESGWLASERSVAALTAEIENAANHREELARRGARARERVVSDFSLSSMRARYAAIYASL
jgi:glycosyltransferase involved in cell wall biosynthesis